MHAPALTPADVRRRRFALVGRGFDSHEVLGFLGELATQLEAVRGATPTSPSGPRVAPRRPWAAWEDPVAVDVADHLLDAVELLQERTDGSDPAAARLVAHLLGLVDDLVDADGPAAAGRDIESGAQAA